MFDRNTWNCPTVNKQMNSLLKNVTNKQFASKLHLHTHIYVYKQDLALNNPQGLIWHKTPTKQQSGEMLTSPDSNNRTHRTLLNIWGCPHGIMVKLLDCRIVITMILQSNLLGFQVQIPVALLCSLSD